MRARLRWGIMSTAHIARNSLIPAMKAARNAEVIAIASRDLRKAQEVAGEFGIPRAYGDYESLLRDPEVDAVYVPLPAGLHPEWAIHCAEHGKPTLCEKPLAPCAMDAKHTIDEFRRRNLLLSDGFMYRYHEAGHPGRPVAYRNFRISHVGVQLQAWQ